MSSVRDLLNNRYYIPTYQRGYSWEEEHVCALLNDIKDQIEMGNKDGNPTQAYYLASIVIMHRWDNREIRKDIIDGQQRLTTIILILGVIKKRFESDPKYKNKSQAIESMLWNALDEEKFVIDAVDNNNTRYLEKVLKGDASEGKNRVEKRIKSSYDIINTEIHEMNIENVNILLGQILKAEITVHEVNNIIEANRIFLTLNARGKALTNMERIKALLIYHTGLIKNAVVLAQDTQKNFGEMQQLYDAIDEIDKAEHLKMTLDEDILLTWHYCWLEENKKIPASSEVFSELESKLKNIRDNGEKRAFITKYVTSVHHFFTSLKEIVEQTTTDPVYYDIIANINLTKVIWPLAVCLQYKGVLNEQIEYAEKTYPIIDFIKIIDKIHRCTGVQGITVISMAYKYFQESDLDITKVCNELIQYYEQRWLYPTNRDLGYDIYTDGFQLKSGRSLKDKYFLSLLSDYMTRNYKNDIRKLKAFHKFSPVAIPLLRSYPDIKIRHDHGCGTQKIFNQVCLSGGNLILIGNTQFTTINDAEKVGPLSPLEKKSIIARNNRTPQDTRNLLKTIQINNDINKDSIEDRENDIKMYLRNKWEFG